MERQNSDNNDQSNRRKEGENNNNKNNNNNNNAKPKNLSVVSIEDDRDVVISQNSIYGWNLWPTGDTRHVISVSAGTCTGVTRIGGPSYSAAIRRQMLEMINADLDDDLNGYDPNDDDDLNNFHPADALHVYHPWNTLVVPPSGVNREEIGRIRTILTTQPYESLAEKIGLKHAPRWQCAWKVNERGARFIHFKRLHMLCTKYSPRSGCPSIPGNFDVVCEFCMMCECDSHSYKLKNRQLLLPDGYGSKPYVITRDRVYHHQPFSLAVFCALKIGEYAPRFAASVYSGAIPADLVPFIAHFWSPALYAPAEKSIYANWDACSRKFISQIQHGIDPPGTRPSARYISEKFNVVCFSCAKRVEVPKPEGFLSFALPVNGGIPTLEQHFEKQSAYWNRIVQREGPQGKPLNGEAPLSSSMKNASHPTGAVCFCGSCDTKIPRAVTYENIYEQAKRLRCTEGTLSLCCLQKRHFDLPHELEREGYTRKAHIQEFCGIVTANTDWTLVERLTDVDNEIYQSLNTDCHVYKFDRVVTHGECMAAAVLSAKELKKGSSEEELDDLLNAMRYLCRAYFYPTSDRSALKYGFPYSDSDAKNISTENYTETLPPWLKQTLIGAMLERIKYMDLEIEMLMNVYRYSTHTATSAQAENAKKIDELEDPLLRELLSIAPGLATIEDAENYELEKKIQSYRACLDKMGKQMDVFRNAKEYEVAPPSEVFVNMVSHCPIGLVPLFTRLSDFIRVHMNPGLVPSERCIREALDFFDKAKVDKCEKSQPSSTVSKQQQQPHQSLKRGFLLAATNKPDIQKASSPQPQSQKKSPQTVSSVHKTPLKKEIHDAYLGDLPDLGQARAKAVQELWIALARKTSDEYSHMNNVHWFSCRPTSVRANSLAPKNLNPTGEFVTAPAEPWVEVYCSGCGPKRLENPTFGKDWAHKDY